MFAARRKKFFLTLAITAVVLFGMSWLGFLALEYLKKSGENLAVAKAKLNQAISRHESLRREPIRLDELADTRSELERFFVSKENPLEFIEAIEKLGKRMSLEVDITFLEGSRSGQTTYSLIVSGSYAEVMRFLEKFEYAPFAFRLKELELGTAAQSRVPGDLKVKSGSLPALREFRAELIILAFDAGAKL